MSEPLRSMTGYGRASGLLSGRSVTVEARSVNARYLDVRVRTGFSSLAIEARIETLIRSRFQRGHVEVRVSLTSTNGAAVRANLTAAENAKRALEEIRASLALTDPITLPLLASQPGVLERELDAETDWAALDPLVGGALDALEESRQREGMALGKEMLQRVAHVSALLEGIERAAVGRPVDLKTELESRLGKLDLSVPVDSGRVAQELALLVQRLDTTEERVRLSTHLAMVTELLTASSAAGRRIDFLLQEVQRELSTIAAKSQSATVSQLVAEARAEAEKLREQAQNLE